MSGAILSLPQYVFMAWCSVKAQGKLYTNILEVHAASNFTLKMKTPQNYVAS